MAINIINFDFEKYNNPEKSNLESSRLKLKNALLRYKNKITNCTLIIDDNELINKLDKIIKNIPDSMFDLLKKNSIIMEEKNDMILLYTNSSIFNNIIDNVNNYKKEFTIIYRLLIEKTIQYLVINSDDANTTSFVYCVDDFNKILFPTFINYYNIFKISMYELANPCITK
jgi:hypothetical protein